MGFRAKFADMLRKEISDIEVEASNLADEKADLEDLLEDVHEGSREIGFQLAVYVVDEEIAHMYPTFTEDPGVGQSALINTREDLERWLDKNLAFFREAVLKHYGPRFPEES